MFISELFPNDLEETKNLHKKVKIIRGPKDCVGKIGTVGEVRHGMYKGAPKVVTVDYQRDDGMYSSIQLPAADVRIVKNNIDEIRKKEEPVRWIPVDTVAHPLGTPYSPKNKYIDNPDYNTGKDSKTKTNEEEKLNLQRKGNKNNRKILEKLYMKYGFSKMQAFNAAWKYKDASPEEVEGWLRRKANKKTGQVVDELTDGYPD